MTEPGGWMPRWTRRHGAEPESEGVRPDDEADSPEGFIGGVDVTPARTPRRDLAAGRADDGEPVAGIGSVLNHLVTIERVLTNLEGRFDASVDDLTTRLQADVRRLGSDLTEVTGRIDDELGAKTRELAERVSRFGETHHVVLTDLVAQNNAIAQAVARLEAKAEELRLVLGDLGGRVEAQERQVASLRNQLTSLEDADANRFATLQEGEEQIVERLGDLVQEIQAWRRRIAVRADADRSHEPAPQPQPQPPPVVVEEKRRRGRRRDG